MQRCAMSHPVSIRRHSLSTHVMLNAILLLCLAGPADVEFPSFVSALNKELDKLDYSLRLSRDEQNGVMYVIMVNTNQDSATELATQFTPTEMTFIRELVHNRRLAH